MPKHARSRDGCVNCKQKRIKCDETRPQCKNCIDRHVKCPGFARQFKWKPIPAFITASTCERQGSEGASSGHARPLSITNGSRQDSYRAKQARPTSYTAAERPADLACPRVRSLRTSSEDTLDQLLSSQYPTSTIASGRQCSTASFSRGDQRQSATSTFHVPILEADELDLACFEQEFSYYHTSLKDTCSSNEQLYAPSTDDIWARTPHEVSNVAPTDIQSLPKELSGTTNHNAIACMADTHFDDTWLYEPANPASVTSLPGNNDPAADEFNHEMAGQEQADPWKMCFTTMALRNNAPLDPGTKKALTTHYFDYICQIVSCFDSHESPFRTDIPQKMLTCEYIDDCVVGMSAAHLANSVSGMENIALSHQNRAMFALSSVIDSLFTSRDEGSEQYWLSCSSTKTTRYHALLASLLLNMSSAWYDSSSTGLTHLFGARILFQAWIIDEGLSIKKDQPPLLSREQSFIIGAMAFLECLASIIIDQPIDVLKYLQPFAKISEDQRIYPNPWTGVSTPLFIVLAEVATLIRQKRNLKAMSSAESQAESLSELDEKMNKHASQLFASALTHRTPSIAKMEETKDSKTPLDHLIGMDCIFRLVILLELSQIFPDVVLCDDNKTASQREAQKVALDFAIAALRLISELPKTSGTLLMLSIPLISAGSALQNHESYQGDYNLDSGSFSRLRKDVSDIINRPLPISAWRDQVELRIEQLERRVGLAPVRRMRELLEAVWRQADEPDVGCGTSLRNHIHWMDVMIDEKLETLLG